MKTSDVFLSASRGRPASARSSSPVSARLSPAPLDAARRLAALGLIAIGLTTLGLSVVGLTGCTDRGEPVGPDGPGPTALTPFRSAASCGACHVTHFEEWKESMHAYGGVDPLMERMAEIAAAEPGGGPVQGEDCLSCHAPALVRQQRWLASLPPGSSPDIEDLSEDGINCDVCHSISIIPPIGDIEFLKDVDPTGPKLAGLRDPMPNGFHESLFDASFTTSIQCAACHQVDFDDGRPLENTYVEWEESILSGQGIECQTCHMPRYTGNAVAGAPLREDLHRHHFTGVDYAYGPFRGIDLDAQKARIRELLENSVSVSVLDLPASVVPGEDLAFSIRVRNDRTGHAIPSGVSFAREMWIQATLLDADRNAVGQTGALDGNGDIVESADLAIFRSKIFDAQGERTYFTWRAVSIDDSGLLDAGESRAHDFTWTIPAGTPGPLTLELALRFRPVSHAQVREVGLAAELLPIEIFDMWTDTRSIVVGP